jgi:putative ABC transport system substrate-binding protein
VKGSMEQRAGSRKPIRAEMRESDRHNAREDTKIKTMRLLSLLRPNFCSANLKSAFRNPKSAILIALLLALSLPAEAQQAKKVHRIGYLSRSSESDNLPRIQAFRQGLRDLGYVEGQNILIEYRYAEGNSDRLPPLAADLVARKVDVIVAPGTGPVSAAKQATKTVPIIMVTAPDPVAGGFINSLARPGGNVTGLTNVAPDLSGKRLELLKEAVPKAARSHFMECGG